LKHLVFTSCFKPSQINEDPKTNDESLAIFKKIGLTMNSANGLLKTENSAVENAKTGVPVDLLSILGTNPNLPQKTILRSWEYLGYLILFCIISVYSAVVPILASPPEVPAERLENFIPQNHNFPDRIYEDYFS